MSVAEPTELARHRLVDDGHRTAADQLLGLDQTEVGVDAGGVGVEHEADGAGRREHRGLRVAYAVTVGVADGALPCVGGGVDQFGTDGNSSSIRSSASWCMFSTWNIASESLANPRTGHPGGRSGA